MLANGRDQRSPEADEKGIVRSDNQLEHLRRFEVKGIPGTIYYFPNFVTQEEADNLISEVSAVPISGGCAQHTGGRNGFKLSFLPPSLIGLQIKLLEPRIADLWCAGSVAIIWLHVCSPLFTLLRRHA